MSPLFLLLAACDPEGFDAITTTATPEPCADGALGWRVSPGGRLSWVHPVPGEVLTLSEPGDLTLCPGSHTVEVVIEAPVSIFGEGAAGLVGDGFTPVQIGDGAGKVLLSGLSVSGGLGQRGGGIFCDTAAELSLHGLQLFDNTAELGGGAHFGSGCAVTITDTAITDNAALVGAGVSLLGADGHLEGVTFTGNTGLTVLAAADADLVQILDTGFASNFPVDAAVSVDDVGNLSLWGVEVLAQDAAGVRLEAVAQTLIGESRFARLGGGIVGEDAGTLRVFDTTFERCEAEGEGGAIRSGFEAVTLSQTTFHRNDAAAGDAIWMDEGLLSGQSVVFADQPDEDIHLAGGALSLRLGSDFTCTPTDCLEIP